MLAANVPRRNRRVVKNRSGFRSALNVAMLVSVLSLASTLWTPSAFATGHCKLEQFGQLAVTMRNLQPLVQGTVNGQPARFIVDSGAFFDVMSAVSAKKFGLKLRHLPRGMQIMGVTGQVNAMLGRAKSLTLAGYLGGRALHRADFIVPDNSVMDRADGRIGDNLLDARRTDTEYDLGNGVIRMLVDQNCNHSMLAYWQPTGAVAVMDMESDWINHQILGRAKLNGKWIHVVFDTGSPHSALTLHAAKYVGISIRSRNVVDGGLMMGLGIGRIDAWVAHFDSLDLGGEVIKHSRLVVADMDSMRSDLLLGADFFLSHRVLVSYTQHKIYFTYDGGPVFDLGGLGQSAGVEAASPHGAAPSVKTQMKRPDVASLKRRALAQFSRHEYGAALALLNTVVRLEPGNADNYLQRGKAYLASRKPALALKDMNAALYIAPESVQARLLRGIIRLNTGNEKGARHDFDVALKSSQNSAQTTFDVVNAYVQAQYYDEAIFDIDRWIADHPKSQLSSYALSQACYTRALANKDLKAALADCKASFRRQHRDSGMLANLALVYLRLGDYPKAIKYYKASIRLQPKSAWTRYGLGLADARDGRNADSARSIKAALAIDADVASAYHNIGLYLAPK